MRPDESLIYSPGIAGSGKKVKVSLPTCCMPWLALHRDIMPGGTVRDSLDDIGRRAGIDRQMASRAVDKLTGRKMLQLLRRGGLNQRPSEYRVFPFPMD